MSKGHVLVTGGSGFIGSNISLELVSRGYDVTVLDNMSYQIHGKHYRRSSLYNAIKDCVHFIKGDVVNRNLLKRVIASVDSIIHLAAETGTGQSMYEINRYTSVNIGGTAQILDILTNEKNKVKKILVASSRAIYGEGAYICIEHGMVFPLSRRDEDMKNKDYEVKCPICKHDVSLVPTDEFSKKHPTSIYGFTKQAQEEMCMITGKTLHIPTVAFRYQNVYGPGQSLRNPYTGILSIFSTRILNNKSINIFEDGKESRDFVYIDDVVRGTILGLESEKADYESFNIGSGRAINVHSIAQRLCECYGHIVDITVSGNYRLGDIRHNLADITKAKKLLNYQPKISFDEGIKKFTEWVKTQDIEVDCFEKSINEMRSKGLYK